MVSHGLDGLVLYEILSILIKFIKGPLIVDIGFPLQFSTVSNVVHNKEPMSNNYLTNTDGSSYA